MKIFMEDEPEEIKPLKESNDKGTVISPKKKESKEENGRDDIIKGIIAEDTIELGKREAAMIHGVSASSALNYSHGIAIKDPDIKAQVVSLKHGIESIAVAKLMDTLNLLSPEAIDKEVDKVRVIEGLAKVVERITGNAVNKNTNVVHLELHMPSQKKESDYEVINVTR